MSLWPVDKNFTALMQAQDWQQLVRASQDALAPLAVDSFLKIMKIADGAGRTHLHVVSSLPSSVADLFLGADENGSDPVMRHVARTGIPLAWDIDQLCREGPTQIYQGLKASGIRTGLSIAGRSEHNFSRIDFYSMGNASFSGQQQRNHLLLFSCYLNEAARTLWRQQSPKVDTPVLTSRERQCLRWSASGKTSNEIGSILGISQNTVYYHLKKAASKFQVYGTRHAISRAIEMGLI
ncbi:DNA-binding CsgD family transcriptional regulator [Janthinobacterium sp. CG_23.3]|uniref:helix-turn-helix transcriptional regulator n=1 Tax=Janthinobacterium sp. CG_23.3 TaxID=3349634 RepID=UPI0038D37E29